MDYIKLFETHSEYETYINSENKKIPNLCYCEDANDIHLNVIQKYLIIEYFVSDDEYSTQLYNYSEVDNIIGDEIFNKIKIDDVEVSITDIDEAEGKYAIPHQTIQRRFPSIAPKESPDCG